MPRRYPASARKFNKKVTRTEEPHTDYPVGKHSFAWSHVMNNLRASTSEENPTPTNEWLEEMGYPIKMKKVDTRNEVYQLTCTMRADDPEFLEQSFLSQKLMLECQDMIVDQKTHGVKWFNPMANINFSEMSDDDARTHISALDSSGEIEKIVEIQDGMLIGLYRNSAGNWQLNSRTSTFMSHYILMTVRKAFKQHEFRTDRIPMELNTTMFTFVVTNHGSKPSVHLRSAFRINTTDGVSTYDSVCDECCISVPILPTSTMTTGIEALANCETNTTIRGYGLVFKTGLIIPMETVHFSESKATKYKLGHTTQQKLASFNDPATKADVELYYPKMISKFEEIIKRVTHAVNVADPSNVSEETATVLELITNRPESMTVAQFIATEIKGSEFKILMNNIVR